MADTSVLKARQEQEQVTTAKEVEVKEVFSDTLVAPLDFSFLHLTTIEDAEREEPRVPVLGKLCSPRGYGGKFAGRCLRLNNNQLSEIKTLNVFIEKTFVNPMMIGWIDLSFNALQIIDPVLLEFKNLEILYLHGNSISNIKEVDKLANLSGLRKLTLHGNEIEKEKGYRFYVLSSMPWLRNFDFSAVTKCEARTAETWKRLNNPNKKKKKIEATD